ncbi:hypothetical protein StrepF001_11110 [Streptomyces sp. F001]|nr:hypothetical protein StrepF001_11110 [Streptomyces sp. F001]
MPRAPDIGIGHRAYAADVVPRRDRIIRRDAAWRGGDFPGLIAAGALGRAVRRSCGLRVWVAQR